MPNVSEQRYWRLVADMRGAEIAPQDPARSDAAGGHQARSDIAGGQTKMNTYAAEFVPIHGKELAPLRSDHPKGLRPANPVRYFVFGT